MCGCSVDNDMMDGPLPKFPSVPGSDEDLEGRLEALREQNKKQ